MVWLLVLKLKRRGSNVFSNDSYHHSWKGEGYIYQTDRQTDILLTEIKVITALFVIVIREIYVHVYTRMLFC